MTRIGLGISVCSGGAPVASAASIFGASNIAWHLRGDSVSGATWADLSGNGRDFTLVNSPTVNATGLNGKQTVSFTRGSSHRAVNTTHNRAAPGTTPRSYLLVARLHTAWNSAARIIGGNSDNNISLFCTTSSPRVSQQNNSSVNENANGTVGSWFLWYVSFTNSTSDQIRIGNTAAVTGANAGNQSSAGIQIAASSGAAHCNLEVGEAIEFIITPTTEQVVTFGSAVVAPYWGATVGVPAS